MGWVVTDVAKIRRKSNECKVRMRISELSEKDRCSIQNISNIGKEEIIYLFSIAELLYTAKKIFERLIQH